MNQGPTVKLWTWHEPDFSLTSGRVDHSRSLFYRTMDTIPPAYSKLADHVGTDQIIWCYSKPGERIRIQGNSCVEWGLNVPSDKILAIIDTWVWERIIESGAFPPYLRDKWAWEAGQGDYETQPYIEEKVKEYLKQPPPKGDWWKSLFVDSINDGDTTVLVEHPIPRKWVLTDCSNAR